MLERIPREVFWLVVEELPATGDLKRLSEVSRKVHGWTIPKLYERVVIKAQSEKYIKLNIEPFLQANPTSPLAHVKHLTISAPFHFNLYQRCIHYRDDEDQHNYTVERGNSTEEKQTKFQRFTAEIVSLLQQLQPGNLKSFSWDLGTCIPGEILGALGYLPLIQPALECISITAGFECSRQDNGLNTLDFSNFHALQQISWTGLHDHFNYDPLRKAIATNSKTLTYLQLDYVSDADDDHDEDDEDTSDSEEENAEEKGPDYNNLLAHEILGLKRSTTTSAILLPALKSLALGYVSLENARTALIHALNIHNLSHLSLRDCADMEEFLREAVKSSQAFRLLSLEYYCESSDDINVLGVLEETVRSSPDLTSLFISIPGPEMTLHFWRALAENRPHLKRFVYHQRCSNLDEDSLNFEEIQDLNDLSLLPQDMRELRRAGENHPFAQLDLECLGLGASPSIVKAILERAGVAKSLKLLHIRRSGPDMAGNIKVRGNMFDSTDLMSENEYDDEDSSGDDDMDIDEDEDLLATTVRPLIASAQSAQSSMVIDGIAVDDDTAIEMQLKSMPRDFLAFAYWAFGPDGIQSLQVLAYGDFSYSNRFIEYNHVLCRQSWTAPKLKFVKSRDGIRDGTIHFRPIRATDVMMSNLVEENMDFLAACPVDSIVIKSEY